MSSVIEQLSDLVDKLRDADAPDDQEDILTTLIELSQNELERVQDNQKAYWIIRYESYCDTPCEVEYTLMGYDTKNKIIHDYNVRFDCDLNDPKFKDAAFVDYDIFSVDSDSYHNKWVPLLNFTKALGHLKWDSNCPREIVAELEKQIQYIKEDLNLKDRRVTVNTI